MARTRPPQSGGRVRATSTHAAHHRGCVAHKLIGSPQIAPPRAQHMTGARMKRKMACSFKGGRAEAGGRELSAHAHRLIGSSMGHAGCLRQAGLPARFQGVRTLGTVERKPRRRCSTRRQAAQAATQSYGIHTSISAHQGPASAFDQNSRPDDNTKARLGDT